eukprot:TRINITY_DN10885_c0_g3_i1.p1 TRINITY_DN10885_c0_g3~~TRINITY_DN10885_c0_g3_i1.p1  ORF type:complete len:115 (+),score=5.78 TRINITY_DN10885_c0_g3_i1:498-842(+)
MTDTHILCGLAVNRCDEDPKKTAIGLQKDPFCALLAIIPLVRARSVPLAISPKRRRPSGTRALFRKSAAHSWAEGNNCEPSKVSGFLILFCFRYCVHSDGCRGRSLVRNCCVMV